MPVYNLHAVKALPAVFMSYEGGTITVRLGAYLWWFICMYCVYYRRFDDAPLLLFLPWNCFEECFPLGYMLAHPYPISNQSSCY
jgi:hypothetical protein